VISAASCYEHARKQKEKGVPWGGVLMLRRCEAGKETSGREIRGGRRAGDVGWRRDVGKVRRHVRMQPPVGNGVRMLGTQRTEKRRRMRPDAAPAPQMQD